MRPGVVISELGVRFDIDRQKRPTTPALSRIRRHCTAVWGLRHISGAIEAGTAVALIGPNGAGKTTLLRTIAGVLEPDEGQVQTCGRIGSLLAINAGAMPRLTGRENALLLGVLAGLPRRWTREALDQINELAGLSTAFDRPVSTYSQGMRARLGFAVIQYSRPDILLLDEIHEAIDGEYRRHVEQFARDLQRSGGIVIAAGHDHQELARLCDQALRLDGSGLHPVPGWADGAGAVTADAAGAVTAEDSGAGTAEDSEALAWPR